MLARVNRRLEVHGAKARRRGQERDIHAAVDDLLVGVQPNKALLGRDFDLIRVILLQALQTPLELILERVAYGREDDVLVGGEGLAGGAGATAPATDQADAQSIGVFLGKEWSGQNRRRGQHAADQSRSFEKFPARSETVTGCIHNTSIARPFRPKPQAK